MLVVPNYSINGGFYFQKAAPDNLEMDRSTIPETSKDFAKDEKIKADDLGKNKDLEMNTDVRKRFPTDHDKWIEGTLNEAFNHTDIFTKL